MQKKLWGAFLLVCGAANAGTLTISGVISQNTVGSAPIANPSLNNINDGDAYSVALNFSGGIASAGTYGLTSIVFSDGWRWKAASFQEA